MPGPTDRYFHVDTTHSSYNSMLKSCGAKHEAHTPKGTLLSANVHANGKEALVKVRGAAGWIAEWMSAPFILRIFTPEDHHEAAVMVRTLEWEPNE